MSMRKIATAAFLLGTLFASSAFATTVKSLDPFWVKTGATTWVLPANLGPCGVENEPSCEPLGVFLLSQPIGGITAGYATLTSADGSISDFLVWGNTGPLGQGVLTFYSDPEVPAILPPFNAGSLCNETDAGGCTVGPGLLMSDGTILTLSIASDGENIFRAFGAPFDTSDGIQFTNAAPEPATLALFGAGLAGLGALRRRKARRNA